MTKPSLSTPPGRERMQERDEPTTLLVKALASATPEVTVEDLAATLGGTCGGCGLTRNARVPVKVATPAERTLVDIARPVVAPRNQGDATWLG